MLLYVDATISKRVRVSSQSTAINVWNSGLFRKRQTTELEDGGFGLLPIKDSYLQLMQKLKGESSKPPSTPPRELSKKDYNQYMDEKMKLLVHAKLEAEHILETIICKFPGDDMFDRYKHELDTLFNTNRWTSTKKKEMAMNKSKGKLHEEVTLAPSFANSAFDECWKSPGFVAAAIDCLDREVERSEKRKSAKKLRVPDFSFDPPSFDLGISPEKKQTTGGDGLIRESRTTETKRSLFANTMVHEKIKAEAEAIPMETSSIRESRRNVKLGDHLRSPFVKRSVDFSVNAEEKRVYEWH